jgi:Zn finger protein HypA/HybF involved in hydrogenase expression
MTNLVRMVEEVCGKESRITPSVITLEVASDSHLAQHTLDDLQMMFDFVTRNSLAQDAKLAVTTKTAQAKCQSCKNTIDCLMETLICPNCESGDIERDETPEVVLKNIKYTDRSS